MKAFLPSQLIKESKLTKEDLNEVFKIRQNHNQLGLAYQIAFVLLYNKFPQLKPLELNKDLLKFVAVEIKCDPDVIFIYQKRRQTGTKHRKQIHRHLRRKSLKAKVLTIFEKFIFKQAFQIEKLSSLIIKAQDYLRNNRILEPADSILKRVISKQRILAKNEIYNKINSLTSIDIKSKLDSLLDIDDDKVYSDFQMIKENPKKPSPDAVKILEHKLDVIRNTGILSIDTTWLNNNYARSLYIHAKRCDTYRIKQMKDDFRYSSLVCFLKTILSEYY